MGFIAFIQGSGFWFRVYVVYRVYTALMGFI